MDNYQFEKELVARLNELIQGERRSVARAHIAELLDQTIVADASLQVPEEPLVVRPLDATHPQHAEGFVLLGPLGLLNGIVGLRGSENRIAARYELTAAGEELAGFELRSKEQLHGKDA